MKWRYQLKQKMLSGQGSQWTGCAKNIAASLLIGLLAGCSQTEQPLPTYAKASLPSVKCQTKAISVNAILANDKLVWQQCGQHEIAVFEQVLSVIVEALAQKELSQQKTADKNYTPKLSNNGLDNNKLDNSQLENALYYLRAYSYLGDVDALTKAHWQQLDTLLLALGEQLNQQGDAEQIASDHHGRLAEHFLVTLYRYLPQTLSADDKSLSLSAHLATVQTLVERYQNHSISSQQIDYTQLELYRTLGILAYYGRNHNELSTALLADGKLVNLLTEKLAIIEDDNWQLAHHLWGLANLHIISDKTQQSSLDEKVKTYIFTRVFLSDSRAKSLFSQIYLANSLRTTDHCLDEFSGQCNILSIAQVLPINHQCSDSLFIRANSMTSTQLNNACQQLIAQEDFFHSTLNTGRLPVADDLNQRLRVVIFNNYSQYNQHGQLTFNIFTNNGGMYIEGTPSKQGNQATFYSFEAFWQQDGFAVWNLAHEYVHYLDGRFVKYGGFGHFPEKLVWWSEGLAEYISKQNDNPKAIKLAQQTAVENWPSLADIFATTYQDGTDRVYRWSYLAHRFIFTFHSEQGQEMAMHLKQDDFASYDALLNKFAQQHQHAFSLWLHQMVAEYQQQVNGATPDREKMKQPRFMYRYLYRDYLRPSHLPISAKHFHFEYWG